MLFFLLIHIQTCTSPQISRMIKVQNPKKFSKLGNWVNSNMLLTYRNHTESSTLLHLLEEKMYLEDHVKAKKYIQHIVFKVDYTYFSKHFIWILYSPKGLYLEKYCFIETTIYVSFFFFLSVSFFKLLWSDIKSSKATVGQSVLVTDFSNAWHFVCCIKRLKWTWKAWQGPE